MVCWICAMRSSSGTMPRIGATRSTTRRVIGAATTPAVA
jgi:hypothetical protein